MSDIVAYFHSAFTGEGLSVCTLVVRIILSMLCAGAIGIERGRANQAAGMRTYMLVSLGACIAMVTGEELYLAYGTGDPARLGAQVISGIGFLGAGSIIVSGKVRVRGLTTAAGLWVAACIGLSIGSGFWEAGLATTLSVTFIMTLMKRVESAFSHQLCVYLELEERFSVEHLANALQPHEIRIFEIKMNESLDGRQKLILWLSCGKRRKRGETLRLLMAIPGVQYAEFVSQ